MNIVFSYLLCIENNAVQAFLVPILEALQLAGLEAVMNVRGPCQLLLCRYNVDRLLEYRVSFHSREMYQTVCQTLPTLYRSTP